MNLLTSPMRAQEAAPRVVAVATARAQILAGVRATPLAEMAHDDSRSRRIRLPKPRERPCPEADKTPCRLIVVDMP